MRSCNSRCIPRCRGSSATDQTEASLWLFYGFLKMQVHMGVNMPSDPLMMSPSAALQSIKWTDDVPPGTSHSHSITVSATCVAFLLHFDLWRVQYQGTSDRTA